MLLDSPGYCEPHAKVYHQLIDSHRGNANKRGYNRRWQKARLTYLGRNPLCIECEKRGYIVQSTEVDHIIPHRGDSKLFWDTSNWQALCKPCHSRKTATEDGGFGYTGGGPKSGPLSL